MVATLLLGRFSPAVSKKAITEMCKRIRKWRIHRRSDLSINDLAQMLNPVVQGWINYYGSFYKSVLRPVLQYINQKLVHWAMRKYKKLRGHQRRASRWLGQIAQRELNLFAHWKFGVRPAAER